MYDLICGGLTYLFVYNICNEIDFINLLNACVWIRQSIIYFTKIYNLLEPSYHIIAFTQSKIGRELNHNSAEAV